MGRNEQQQPAARVAAVSQARAEADEAELRRRRSTTFGGQSGVIGGHIDTQRGLLNKETLTLPKFLSEEVQPNIDQDESFNRHKVDNVSLNKYISRILMYYTKNCSWDGNDDDPENQIPNPVDAYKFFGAGSVSYSIFKDTKVSELIQFDFSFKGSERVMVTCLILHQAGMHLQLMALNRRWTSTTIITKIRLLIATGRYIPQDNIHINY